MTDAFPQKVQDEFLQSFVVQVFLGNHLGFVGRTFGLDDDTYGTLSIGLGVNNEIVSAFGIDKIVGRIIGVFEKIGNQVFMKLFGFIGLAGIQKQDEFRFKQFNSNAVGADFEKSFVECLAWFDEHIFYGVSETQTYGKKRGIASLSLQSQFSVYGLALLRSASPRVRFKVSVGLRL
jgi:hypothetical protein